MSAPAPLSVEELAHRCDAGQFAFATTDELEDIGVIPGQERASEAIELAVGIDREGYNLFVMGPAGCGRHTLVRQKIEARAKRAPRPSDWIYANNFAHPHRPIAIGLPPARRVLLRAPAGFSFAPVKGGEVMGADEFAKLPEAEQQRVKGAIEALQTKLERL